MPIKRKTKFIKHRLLEVLPHGVIERYRRYLPVTSKTPVITLNEGNTPLLFAENITRAFKDRGMTVAISKAKEAGAKAVICASTGNTSASAAAYAARAEMKCLVLIPQKAIALGKLSQAL